MMETRVLMGMPVTINVVGVSAAHAIQKAFTYFEYVDEKFSTYKETSEITHINKGKVRESEYSDDMKNVLALCEETKNVTEGYFDIVARDGNRDPSGLVKGWAIYNASEILFRSGFMDYYVEAGGDIQAHGRNAEGGAWSVGIKNPFNQSEIVKTVYLENGEGVATSGTYIRGQHIYNPKKRSESIDDVVSLTVVGPNIYEADRFATAAFAMGGEGIRFIEKTEGLEGYMIDRNGVATMTSGFEKYTYKHA